MSGKRVIIVDDEAGVREFLKLAAEDIGFEAVLAEDHARFVEQYQRCEPDAVITDLQMPGVDGVELLRRLAGLGCRAHIILLSGMDTKVLDTAKRFALSAGLNVAGALQKPVKLETLQALLERGGDRRRTPRTTAEKLTPEGLDAAIANGELEVHYQPKVALAGPTPGRPVGMEALVRWRHPRAGLVPPVEFIPMAERTGQILPLTRFVLERSLADLAALHRACAGDLSVAVNFTPLLLEDQTLPDYLERCVRDAALEPRHLIVEITESGAMKNVPTIFDVLTRLRIKDFVLSVDDFGTGYSSLVQLYRIPFSELKIDKSFVMEMSDNAEARAIVRLSTNLAKELSLSVCAEGIEDQRTFDALGALGCDKGQGYLMSKPLPVEALRVWLQERLPANKARATEGLRALGS